MKTKTTITELNQEDLVDLLCTATYGSNWLECYAHDKEGVEITEQDCLEDVWAKCLLAGKEISCIDHYAEGEIYGDKKKASVSEDEEESVCYLITLDDIMKGLQASADGTFHIGYGDGNSERAWLKECFDHFADQDRMEMDQPEAEALMQVIMFNELIYG